MVAGCIRQVVILYSNDCMGIGLGGLSIGCLRRVVILQMLSFERVCQLLVAKLPQILVIALL